MKKLISMLLCAMVILSIAIPCFAEDLSQNYNVSPICPWDIPATRGVNPPTEAWNVSTQGPYYFSGQASYSTLYLSKLLYGAAYYSVAVTNYSSTNTLTVNPHDGVPAAPFYVAPNTTMNPLVFQQRYGANYFCLSFNAPSNFSGYVSEWIYQ